jgi:hypothetical protein
MYDEPGNGLISKPILKRPISEIRNFIPGFIVELIIANSKEKS